MTLTDRLLTAIAAKEATARAVQDNSAPWDGQWKQDGEYALRTYNDHVLAYSHTDANGLLRPFKPGVLEHIADNDPANVLLMCQAHREIVERHEPVNGFSGPMCTVCVGCWSTEEGEDWPCQTIRALARGYGISEEET